MKKIILASLVLTSALFSAFSGQSPRKTFSYEIFSAPYFKNLRENSIVSGKKVGFLPVMPDARACQKSAFSTSETQHLLQTMNAYLKDSLQLTAIAIPFAKPEEAPDLFLGSVIAPCRPNYVNPNAISASNSKAYSNRMAGQMATKTWLKELVSEMEKNGLDYVIVPQIGEGYLYPVAKTKQRKSASEAPQAPVVGLDLGINYWLPLENNAVTMQKPVDVLFVKGLLISKEGKITRLAAEGITLSTTEFTASDLNKIETDVRRSDLPGKPLNWKVAANQVVQQLTDRKIESGKPTRHICIF